MCGVTGGATAQTIEDFHRSISRMSITYLVLGSDGGATAHAIECVCVCMVMFVQLDLP